MKILKMIPVLVLVSLFLFGSNVMASPDISQLNFGLFVALEQMEKAVILNWETDLDYLGSIEIYGISDPAIPEEKQNLPLDRLEVQIGTDFFPVGIQPTIIDRNNISGEGEGRLPFIFSFTVLPEDLPGKYETYLYIKEWDKQGNLVKTEKLPLRLEVGPWVRLETETLDLRMIPSRENYNVVSEIPGIVKVTGNTDWELWASLEGEFERKELLLKVLETEEMFRIAQKNDISLKKEFQLLAWGTASAGEDELWIEVPFLMQILDYTTIPAGRINFPVVFRVVPVE